LIEVNAAAPASAYFRAHNQSRKTGPVEKHRARRDPHPNRSYR